MKALLVIPVLVIILMGAYKCGCSMDTLYLMMSLILAGWMASDN